jgi:hypothetical protein
LAANGILIALSFLDEIKIKKEKEEIDKILIPKIKIQKMFLLS